MRALSIGLFSLLALSVACRSGQSGPPTRPESSAQKDQYLIKAEELEKANRDNLYDAVRQLRPGWFTRVTRQRSGSDGILVYLDDRPMGDVTVLRRFSARAVENVRYLGVTEAQVRFGQLNGGRPAILLESLK